MNSSMMVPTTTTMNASTTTNVDRQRVSSSLTMSVRVQNLNNLGCIYVMKGKFIEAKCTFELALQLLQTKGGGRGGGATVSAGVGVHDTTTSQYSTDNDSDNVTTMSIEYDYHDNNNDEELELTLIPSTDVTSTPCSNGSFSSVCRDNGRNDTIKRMTTLSRLYTVPYSGQDQYKQDNNNNTTTTTTNQYYHQIYCLPIVMDEDEWLISSTEGKSLVLIFNTALSFHLLGISYLSSSLLEQQNNHTLFSNGYNHRSQQLQYGDHQQKYHQCMCDFQAAKILYKLVLENIGTLFECGVNKLCHIAIFNNISHLCKSLAGLHVRESTAYYNEAYAYDILLLKAIYWYRYINNVSNPTSSSNSNHSTTSSSSSSSDNSDYAESDLEIIDLFFENVFYLMGAQESTVPASAA